MLGIRFSYRPADGQAREAQAPRCPKDPIGVHRQLGDWGTAEQPIPPPVICEYPLPGRPPSSSTPASLIPPSSLPPKDRGGHGSGTGTRMPQVASAGAGLTARRHLKPEPPRKSPDRPRRLRDCLPAAPSSEPVPCWQPAPQHRIGTDRRARNCPCSRRRAAGDDVLPGHRRSTYPGCRRKEVRPTLASRQNAVAHAGRGAGPRPNREVVDCSPLAAPTTASPL